MKGEMWMESSSIFGGIFGRKEIGGKSSRRLSIQHKWPLYADDIMLYKFAMAQRTIAAET
jgi:hypothetical protein